MSNQRRRLLEVQEVGAVTIAVHTEKKLLFDDNIQEVGEQLKSLVSDAGRKNLLVHCGKVEYMASSMLGKYIGLNKMTAKVDGKFALCCVDPTIYEVFEITGLKRAISVYDCEEDALEVFKTAHLLSLCYREDAVVVTPSQGAFFDDVPLGVHIELRRLVEAFESNYGESGRGVVLNLVQIERISSAALSELLSLKQRADGKKTRLVLCCISRNLWLSGFEHTTLKEAFPMVFATVDEALASFSQ